MKNRYSWKSARQMRTEGWRLCVCPVLHNRKMKEDASGRRVAARKKGARCKRMVPPWKIRERGLPICDQHVNSFMQAVAEDEKRRLALRAKYDPGPLAEDWTPPEPPREEREVRTRKFNEKGSERIYAGVLWPRPDQAESEESFNDALDQLREWNPHMMKLDSNLLVQDEIGADLTVEPGDYVIKEPKGGVSVWKEEKFWEAFKEVPYDTPAD